MSNDNLALKKRGVPVTSKAEQDKLIAQIPSTAKRIKVEDEFGQVKWRDIEEGLQSILTTDKLLSLNGKPVTMKTDPGRKPTGKIPLAPTNHNVAKLKALKDTHFQNDRLLQMLDTSLESEEVLLLCLRGIAQEASSLEFERLEAERTGKDTSQISLRRIGALKSLVEAWLKRKEQLASRMVDMESPAFERLFKFLVDTFQESVMEAGVAQEQMEHVFTRLRERMEDDSWGEEARVRMRGN